MSLSLEEIIVELRARASQSVPFAGMVLGDLQRGASYTAARTKNLGVPVFWSGGKLRTASLDIARRLGVEDAVTGKLKPQAEAAPKPIQVQSRKTVVPITKTTPARKSAAPDKSSKSKEHAIA
jgi:hypothetical protein